MASHVTQYLTSFLNKENGHFSTPDQQSVSSVTLERILKSTKRNKAPGEDGVTYEHMLYGGGIILSLLCKLFSAMLRYGHVPVAMKKGIIFTIFKGGSKNRKDPNSYRAITLTSCILKLFERIILNRLNDSNCLVEHPLQGGFRRGLGCMMTSLALSESLYFAKENNSKLYVCFLDCKQAFDRVWHDGLFYKLMNKNVDRLTLNCIMNMYKGSTSIVRHNGLFSDPVPVRQGTRQGGVSSPSMYLIYIEELISELEHSGQGFCITGSSCSSLSVADDMALLSFSKSGLQAMIDICYRYSIKWRFTYNPDKCSVVVFNETKYAFNTQSRTWILGQNLISEKTSYNHLGITLNKYLNFNDNIVTSCRKLRSTLLSLVNVGLHPNGLNPLTAFKIYKSVVIPKALYGCEIWPPQSRTKQLQLEQAHRFCIKYIEHVPTYTKTDVCMSLLGSRNIEFEIDLKKLNFLGQLCRLHTNHISYRIFTERLKAFSVNGSVKMGFIPEIDRLLKKYNLLSYLTKFLETGSFPSKLVWKSTIHRTVTSVAEAEWFNRVNSCTNLRNFLQVKPILQLPTEIVYLSRFDTRLKRSCELFLLIVCKLFSDTFTNKCPKCLSDIDSVVEHMLCFCKYTLELRVELYNNILTLYGMRIFVKFINMQPRIRTITVLMCFRNILNEDAKALVFQRMCYRLLSYIAYCFSNCHTIERCPSRQ